MLNQKLSQGHVEIIISFTLFIGFLILIFILINPFSQKTSTESSAIDNLEAIILKNISSNVAKLTIITKYDDQCYNLSVTSYPGKFIEVKENKRLYSLYFHDRIQTTYSPNNNIYCKPENYSYGSYSHEKIIVYEKAQELTNAYNKNYEDLKKSLGVSPDFVFKFRDEIGTEVSEISVSKKMPSFTQRTSKEYPVIIIDKNALVKELNFNLLTW